MKNRKHQKIELFHNVMDNYAFYWNEWTLSGACFLSEKQIVIVNNFGLTGSHKTSSFQLKLTVTRCETLFKRAKISLTINYHKFELWVVHKSYIKLQNASSLTEADVFLLKPISFHNIDYLLKRKFYVLDAKTFKELLEKYAESDLKNAPGWGDRTIESLKQLLKNNNCSHLFRK